MNKKTQLSFKGMLVFIAFFGVLALTSFPSSAKADFLDDFVDFIDPTQPCNFLDPFGVFRDCDDDSSNHHSSTQVPNPTVSISANPLSVSYNGSSTVYWNSNNATSCNASNGANGWSGTKSTSGTFYTGALTNTTTFYISCTNSTGRQANSSVTVNVDNQIQNPTISISANPTSVSYNGSSVITWNSNYASSCNGSAGINGWSGSKSTSGTFNTGALIYTTTFYISCTNSTGRQANSSVTVNVSAQVQTCQDTTATNYGGALPCTYTQVCQDPIAINYHGALPCRYQNYDPAPTVTLRADDTNIDFEDDTTLRWSSSNADSCRASGGTNDWEDEDINTSGTFSTESLTRDTTFRITCYNNGDSADDSVTVRVNGEENNDEPDATTRNATNVRTDSVTLNGRVDGNGSSARAWFEYGTNNNLGYTTSRNSYGSGSTNYDRSISGLASNTTYYFRAVAENSQDTVYGSILTFNTGNGFVNTANNQPTVIISSDSTNLAFNGATFIRWATTDATSCNASSGSIGWAGAKNIGTGSFYTGSLTTSRTYTITCGNSAGSSTDSVTIGVRGQVLGVTTVKTVPVPTPTSIVLINSSVNSNQPIVSTLDNARPQAGEEINYTVSYQNIGTGTITGIILQIPLPQEVNYIYSSRINPSVFGNTLIFNSGTLGANGQDTVTIRVRVKENTAPGTNLNFPAILSYIDPAGLPQSVTANASAQVWSEPVSLSENTNLGANVFGAGFLPTNLFGWLLLLVLVLTLVLLAKYLLVPDYSLSFRKQTVTTLDQPLGKKTTTTTME